MLPEVKSYVLVTYDVLCGEVKFWMSFLAKLFPAHLYYSYYIFVNNAEIIVSGGMTMPQIISPIERIARQSERIPLNRIT